MKSLSLKIPLTKPENDLIIIYKEGQKGIKEFKSDSNEFLNCLRYFRPKRQEIEQTKLICIHEDIYSEIFSNFIASIQTKEINITDDNYEQYYYLSDKFEYIEMKNQIELFIENRPDIVSIVEDISTNSNEKKEEIVAKNLDFCIKSGLLNNVNLETIIRIINSPKRIIKDHHLLFNFVVNLIRNYSKQKECNKINKELILLLPSSLDYSLMTEEEIEELINVEGDDNNGFILPSKTNDKLKFLISKSKEDDQFKNDLESRVKKVESLLDEFIKIKEILNEKDKTIIELTQKNESQERKIVELSNKLDLLQQENEKMHNEDKDAIKKAQQELIDIHGKVVKFEEEKKKQDKELAILNKKSEEKKKQDKELAILNKKSEENKNDGIINVFYDNDVNKRLKGIINHFGNGNSKSVLDKNIVNVTASSIYNSTYPSQNALDHENDKKWFASKDQPDSWLCIDFINHRVSPSHYSIQSHGQGSGKGEYHPQTWEISGSNDNSHWTNLDSHYNDKSLDSKLVTVTFPIQNKTNEYYRYLRIMQKGENTTNSSLYRNVLYFSSIEFFGSYKKY